jgi:hypothetical protein
MTPAYPATCADLKIAFFHHTHCVQAPIIFNIWHGAAAIVASFAEVRLRGLSAPRYVEPHDVVRSNVSNLKPSFVCPPTSPLGCALGVEKHRHPHPVWH